MSVVHCNASQEEANASIRQLQVAGRAGFLDSDDDDDLDDDDDYPEYNPEGTAGGGGSSALETVTEEPEDVASTAGVRSYERSAT